MTQLTGQRLIIHAPNVHMGGGLVLLRALFSIPWLSVKFALLDQRTQYLLPSLNAAAVHYVKRTFLARFLAEWRLWREVEFGDTVLCFHGLPPLLPTRGRVIVFLQNRILVTRGSLVGYTVFTRVRLTLERWMLRYCTVNIDEFIVQTPSMAKDALTVLGSSINVSICPFSPLIVGTATQVGRKVFDFVYVANSEIHKNHTTLLKAWRILADSGFRPSLAITLEKGSELALDFEESAKRFDLNITNVGTLSHEGVTQLYYSSKALIFPSVSESFGLPLIEAARYGLPILAPEMDYVRDISNPVQTFDPYSSTSIARAIRRFIGCPEPNMAVVAPEDFMEKVLK